MSIRSTWRATRNRARQCSWLVLVAALPMSACVRYEKRPLAGDQLAKDLHQRTSLAEARNAPYSSRGLALADVEQLALLLNPGLRTARLRARIPAVGAEQAGRWADPVVGAEALRILDPSPGENSRLYGASLSLTIPISGRLAVEKSQARAETEAALMLAWVAEQELLRQFRHHWAQWQFHHASADATRSAVADAGKVLRGVDLLAEGGEITRAEAATFRTAALQRQMTLSALDAAVVADRLELHRLIGVLPGAELPIDSFSPPPALAEITTSDTLPLVLATSPPVLHAAAEYQVAEQTLRLEVRRQYPDLEIGPLYGREDGGDRLGLGFSLPIPILNGNRRAIAEATAARDAAGAAWEESAGTALAELHQARARLDAALAARSVVQEQLLPLAEAQRRDVQQQLDAGEFDALILLEAITAREQAALLAATADRDVHTATADLLALLPPEPMAPPEEDSK